MVGEPPRTTHAASSHRLPVLILGIETSCDETGLALYDTERGVLAEQLHSQIAMHAAYGGVVPELASRDHAERIIPLIIGLMHQSSSKLSDIDLVAFTRGPGLPGALLVGAAVANGLAFALGKPVLEIHHLEGHLLSPRLAKPAPDFPFVALLVSGGHTQLIHVGEVSDYRLLGETLDDAAGEAFDKTGSLLGLSYPGGAKLAQLAERGNPTRFEFPRPMLHSPDLDFSFSGLKTAVLTQVRKLEADGPLAERDRSDLAASFQAAVVDVLSAKALKAVDESGTERLVVAGGVGANILLRHHLQKALGSNVYFPPMALCTDNGVMIAFAAAERARAGLAEMSPAQGFSIRSRWPLVTC